MPDYYLVEQRSGNLAGYDFSVMPLFRPALTYEVAYGRLQQFLSRNSENGERNFVIYRDSCPFVRFTVLNDRIIHTNPVYDMRKKREIEQDFYYESKGRCAPTIAHSTISNDWYDRRYETKDDVPQKRITMRVRPMKRNCTKRPM